jgi:hypothetical protein
MKKFSSLSRPYGDILLGIYPYLLRAFSSLPRLCPGADSRRQPTSISGGPAAPHERAGTGIEAEQKRDMSGKSSHFVIILQLFQYDINSEIFFPFVATKCGKLVGNHREISRR